MTLLLSRDYKKSESELQGSNQIRPRRHVTKKNNSMIKTVDKVSNKYTLNSDVLMQHVRGSNVKQLPSQTPKKHVGQLKWTCQTINYRTNTILLC